MTNRSFQTGTNAGSPVSAQTDVDDLIVLRSNFVPGNLYAWGVNTNGVLGLNDIISRSSPVQVGSLTSWKISGQNGQVHAAMLKTDGTLFTMGSNSGLLGLGDSGNRSSPTQVGSLSNWKTVSCGYQHAIALQSNGTLWTWGIDSNGQLGIGKPTPSKSSPVQVGLMSNWQSISGGHGNVIAIKTDNTLWSWGQNGYGELGLSDTIDRSSPVQVVLSNWKIAASGLYHTVAIDNNNYLWTWGSNTYGQLGLGDITHRSSPIQVGSLNNWQSVSAGFFHTIVIKTDGTLWTCGYNGAFGELGLGDGTHRSSPTQVGSLTNWKYAAGANHATAVIKTDGTLWTCGYNGKGALGLGDLTSRSSPVQVGLMSNWKNIGYGKDFMIAQTYST